LERRLQEEGKKERGWIVSSTGRGEARLNIAKGRENGENSFNSFQSFVRVQPSLGKGTSWGGLPSRACRKDT